MQRLIQLCIGSWSSGIGSLRHNTVHIWGEPGESRVLLDQKQWYPASRPALRWCEVYAWHQKIRFRSTKTLHSCTELDRRCTLWGVMYSCSYQGVHLKRSRNFLRGSCLWRDKMSSAVGHLHVPPRITCNSTWYELTPEVRRNSSLFFSLHWWGYARITNKTAWSNWGTCRFADEIIILLDFQQYNLTVYVTTSTTYMYMYVHVRLRDSSQRYRWR